jgi:hypothetical protein
MKSRYVTAKVLTVLPDDALLKCSCVAAMRVDFATSKSYSGLFTIKKVDASTNAVTIYPATGETIDGEASVSLVTSGDSKTFAPCDGGWNVVDESTSKGTSTTPIILATNPGATVKGDSIAIKHSAGAGDCDDCIAAYKRVEVTGSGDAGLTAVGDAPRVYVGAAANDTTVASAAYASQPWVKHDGTGAITAMSAVSALCDVNTGNFTANTVNAIHAHVEGAATVTGQFDVAHLEVYPDVTSLDSVLHMSVDTGAIVQDAIKVSGALAANFIEIEAASTAVVVAAGSTIHHDPNVVTSDAYLIVKIGAVQYALPLYVLSA